MVRSCSRWICRGRPPANPCQGSSRAGPSWPPLPRWRFSADTRLTFRPPAAPATANSVLRRVARISTDVARALLPAECFFQIFPAFLNRFFLVPDLPARSSSVAIRLFGQLAQFFQFGFMRAIEVDVRHLHAGRQLASGLLKRPSGHAVLENRKGK